MKSSSDRFNLAGKVTLVTGATRGIGMAVAQEFSASGAEVWVAGRDLVQAQAVAKDILNGIAVELDVTDAKSVKAAIMAIRKKSGRLDILVNNAGIMRPAMIATTAEADLDQMMQTNIKGSFLCAQLAARLMASKKAGSIINLASIMGTQGASGFTAYSATKAAIVGMTKALAKELAPHNIRVNALAPGFIQTDMTSGVERENRQEALNSIGMKRFGESSDVSQAAMFLGSDASSYITGQIIGIDGSMQV